MSTVKPTTSKSLGEYLLKGYAMLAENCPSCLIPLMRNPKTMDRLCVNCDRVFKAGESINHHEEEEEEGEEEGEEEEEESSSSMQPSSRISKESPKPTNGLEKADPSKLLSDKMLQGWALLETCCPLCSTPLVRDKAKKMLCVTCDLFVMTEREADAAAKASSTPKAASVKPKALTPQASAVAQTASKDLASFSDGAPLVSSLSQSLLRKLQEATTALDSKSVANESLEIKELASMITECANAIKALQSI